MLSHIIAYTLTNRDRKTASGGCFKNGACRTFNAGFLSLQPADEGSAGIAFSAMIVSSICIDSVLWKGI